ncbi:adenylosuccinate lyase, partial [bacterium]
MPTDHETFQSPFTWRYGSDEMRRLWSEAHRRRLMRRVWLALAEAQHAAGLIAAPQLDDLRRTADRIDIDRAAAIEARTRHDVMAEILTWAEQAPIGGGALHLGATSADITDNVDALRLRDGLALVRTRLATVVAALADRVDETAEQATLGWTHLQPAAPTTTGHRLAGALQDFVADLDAVDAASAALRGKGFKGAVGTAASYAALLAGSGTAPADLEADAMRRLGLAPALITTQVYPRKQDWQVLNALAGIAASASTYAFTVRLMQSPPFGEWFEGFAPGQVGSSAMPWKRNPINAENVNSLARLVAALPAVAWQNETLTLLERTLDDSANRRMVLPEAFLATDEILARTERLTRELVFDAAAARASLERYGPFAATERVLMAAAGAGGDRQALHERIRRHSLAAWAAVGAGAPNPLAERLASDPDITRWVDGAAVERLVARPEDHLGDAPARAR